MPALLASCCAVIVCTELQTHACLTFLIERPHWGWPNAAVTPGVQQLAKGPSTLAAPKLLRDVCHVHEATEHGPAESEGLHHLLLVVVPAQSDQVNLLIAASGARSRSVSQVQHGCCCCEQALAVDQLRPR